jgi:hypothetical protein
MPRSAAASTPSAGPPRATPRSTSWPRSCDSPRVRSPPCARPSPTVGASTSGPSWPSPAADSTPPKPVTGDGPRHPTPSMPSTPRPSASCTPPATPGGPPNRRSFPEMERKSNARIRPPANRPQPAFVYRIPAETERQKRCGSPGTCSSPGCDGPPTRSPTRSGPWTGGMCRPGRRGRLPGAWPTCCRRGGTSTRSIRRRCRPGRRGTSAGRWPTPSAIATGRRRADGRLRSGWSCGAPPPCGPTVTTSPRPLLSSAPVRCGPRSRAGSPGWSPSPSRSSAGPAST